MDYTLKAASEIFSDYLTQKKRSKTSSRYAILEYIYTLDKAFNAQTLYQGILQHYRVSYATIYNTLDMLLDCNLIVRYRHENQQTTYYQRATYGTFHHMLICSVCGKVKEFTDIRLRNTIHAKTFKGFKAEKHTLCIYGICSKCAKQQKNKNKIKNES